MGFWRFFSPQEADVRSFASGELEYESDTHEDGLEHDSNDNLPTKSTDCKLMAAFLTLVIVGTANTLLNKLQAVPLYNYPNFTNLFGNFLFIPITFAYILPAYRYGWFQQSISQDQWTMSLRPFAIMGALDCVAGMMQVFCAVYLPGPLLVLLPQAAIPISMIFSRHILGSRYKKLQYIGAFVVLLGIVVVLEPEITQRHKPEYICEAIDIKKDCLSCQVEVSEATCLSHHLETKYTSQLSHLLQDSRYLGESKIGDDDQIGTPICAWIAANEASSGEQWLVLLWSLIMIISCFPMALSTIYKELVLDDDMDPVFLNGWIVVFQTIYSVILAVPAGIASTPPVLPEDVPRNLIDGWKCYLGINSIHDGCHPDDCRTSALYFNLGILVNVVYVLAVMFVVKWGSTSLLFIGLTIMVPLGNLAFAILPSNVGNRVHLSDVLGLLVILMGLILYRSSGILSTTQEQSSEDMSPSQVDDMAEPLLPEILSDHNSSSSLRQSFSNIPEKKTDASPSKVAES
jgi:drug/metabolite transporter (DMT)-like permease